MVDSNGGTPDSLPTQPMIPPPRPPIVNILYSPPPDGDDASSAYASRASDLCTRHQDCVTLGFVGQLIVASDDDKADGLWLANNNDTAITEEEIDKVVLTIFLISCTSDGSVHRNVRKIMRKLRNNGDNDAMKDDAAAEVVKCNHRRHYAIAALGHARCENSANQMADTIFGTARRFDKLLACSGSFDVGGAPLAVPPCLGRLETQVELCGPDQEFDPWINRLVQSLVEGN